MCSTRSALQQQHEAAVVAYRHASLRMKQVRGAEFERVWRLAEQRRAALERTRQALLRHDQEHPCAVEGTC